MKAGLCAIRRANRDSCLQRRLAVGDDFNAYLSENLLRESEKCCSHIVYKVYKVTLPTL